MHHRILELFSGIGGMHCAWKESGLDGEIVAAVDINTVANVVYKHNFPDANLLNRNIQKLTCNELKKLNVNTILMSPPCQPFTRNGKYLDDSDPRTNSFMHIINLLPDLESIEYILIENVKGFECSTVCKILKEKLNQCAFEYQECLLCPSNVGIPNSRLRYYCLARKGNSNWIINRKNEIVQSLPNDYGEPFSLEQIIDKEVPDTYLVDDKLLKRANIIDICFKHSTRSCCFTKAYSHYVEGTGSVLTQTTPQFLKDCFERANRYEVGSGDFINAIKEMKLRFFTPNEILRLMAFPEYYSFPKNISRKQCYRLLGNSVNVRVITVLLRMLYA